MSAADRILASLETKRLRRDWNPDLHPRDSKGRFVETGGIARMWGGGMARVLRALGGRDVLVENLATHERSRINASRLTMVARPDGTAPTKSKSKVRDEDERRFGDENRGFGHAPHDPAKDDNGQDHHANDPGDNGLTPDDPHHRDDEGKPIGEDIEGQDLGATPDDPNNDDDVPLVPQGRVMTNEHDSLGDPLPSTQRGNVPRHHFPDLMPIADDRGGEDRARHVAGNGDALRAAGPKVDGHHGQFWDTSHARRAVRDLSEEYFGDLEAVWPADWHNSEASDLMDELHDVGTGFDVRDDKNDQLDPTDVEKLDWYRDYADQLSELAANDGQDEVARYAANLRDALALAHDRFTSHGNKPIPKPGKRRAKDQPLVPRAWRAEGSAGNTYISRHVQPGKTPARGQAALGGKRFNSLDELQAHWQSDKLEPYTSDKAAQQRHQKETAALFDKLDKPQLSRNGTFVVAKMTVEKDGQRKSGYAVIVSGSGVRLAMSERKGEAVDFANRLEAAQMDGKPFDWDSPGYHERLESSAGQEMVKQASIEAKKAFADKAAKKRQGAAAKLTPATPAPVTPQAPAAPAPAAERTAPAAPVEDITTLYAPGEQVRVTPQHYDTSAQKYVPGLEFVGTVVGYTRNGNYKVREPKHGTTRDYDARRELHKLGTPAAPTERPNPLVQAAQQIADTSGAPRQNIAVGHIGPNNDGDSNGFHKPSNTNDLRECWKNGGDPALPESTRAYMRRVAEHPDWKMTMADHRGFAVIQRGPEQFDLVRAYDGRDLGTGIAGNGFKSEQDASLFSMILGRQVEEPSRPGQEVDWWDPDLATRNRARVTPWRRDFGQRMDDIRGQFDIDHGKPDSYLAKEYRKRQEEQNQQPAPDAPAAAGDDFPKTGEEVNSPDGRGSVMAVNEDSGAVLVRAERGTRSHALKDVTRPDGTPYAGKHTADAPNPDAPQPTPPAPEQRDWSQVPRADLDDAYAKADQDYWDASDDPDKRAKARATRDAILAAAQQHDEQEFAQQLARVSVGEPDKMGHPPVSVDGARDDDASLWHVGGGWEWNRLGHGTRYNSKRSFLTREAALADLVREHDKENPGGAPAAPEAPAAPAAAPQPADTPDGPDLAGMAAATARDEEITSRVDRAVISLGPILNEVRHAAWIDGISKAAQQARTTGDGQPEALRVLASLLDRLNRALFRDSKLDASTRQYKAKHLQDAQDDIQRARQLADERPKAPAPEAMSDDAKRRTAADELDVALDHLILAQRGAHQGQDRNNEQIERAQRVIAAVRDGSSNSAADMGEILGEVEDAIRGRDDLDADSKRYWLAETQKARQNIVSGDSRLDGVPSTAPQSSTDQHTPTPTRTAGESNESVRQAGGTVLGDVPADGVRQAGRGGSEDGVLRDAREPRARQDRRGGGRPVQQDAEGDQSAGRGGEAASPVAGAGAGAGGRGVPAEGARNRAPGAGAESAAGRVDAPRFHPTSQADLAPSGERAKARANVAAVQTLRRIQSENRPATPDEQAILARWSGWGSLPVVLSDKPVPTAKEFRDADGHPDPAAYARALKRWESFGEERAEIRALLNDEEWAAAKRNTLNAHYTDADLVQPIWDLVTGLGFRRGRVLEPGSGSGNFIGHAPPGADMVGVELDPTTAAISQLLYPDAKVVNSPFQDLRLPPESFDVAIGNVPFGNYKLHDPIDNPGRHHSIHDHFILKSLDRVRPGGLVAVVTSRFTMDSEGESARRRMHDMADLVGAVRLPEGAHQRAAGTHVVTDLLVFRRREEGQTPGDDSWVKSTPMELGGHEVPVNQYFQKNPKNILGELTVGRGQFSDHDLTVKSDQNAPVALRAALARMAQDARTRGLTYDATLQNHELSLDLAGDVRDGSIVRGKDGAFMTVEFGNWVELDVHPRQREQLGRLLELKELTNALVELERTTEAEGETEQMRKLRAELARAYDFYVKKHNSPNKPGQHRQFSPPEALERRKAEGLRETPDEWKRPTALALFENDPDGLMVFGLDKWDEDAKAPRKLDILSQRTSAPRHIPDHADTPEDAVALALEHDGGELRESTVARLLNIPEDRVRETLGDLAFVNPTNNRLEARPAYLSGNVRLKLAEARAAAAEDPQYQANVAALEKVVPKDLKPSEIRVKIGAPWVPLSVYNDFLKHIGLSDATVEHFGGNAWNVDGGNSGEIAQNVWGAGGRSAGDIFSSLLHQKMITVRETQKFSDGSTKSYVNHKATKSARAKAKAMVQEFNKWAMADEGRAEQLSRIYNDAFNSIALRNYDSSPLVLPGIKAGWTMRPHQNAAIRRIVQEPTTLLGHVVGAGKTATMVGGAMELRRTGLAKKPAIVVPNHMLEQFSREFVELYPGAKVLAISRKDLHHNKRRKFIAKIAGGDWDAVVLTHNAFDSIPMLPETQQAYMDNELELLRSQIEKIKEKDGESRNLKQMEKTLANQEEALKERLERLKDERGIFFENTGIDYVFVDEAHEYKNLRTISNIPGAAIAGSGQATQLHMVLEHLREANPSGRVASLATGTPIANSVTEAYVLMRYLAPHILEESGIRDFDSWAATFGEVVTNMEKAADGSDNYVEKARFAKFFNVPELLMGYRTFADIQTAKDLGLPTPTVRAGENGRRGEVIAIPASAEQKAYVASLEHEDWIKEPGGVLKAIGFASRAAIDMRLQGGDGHEGGKLDAAAPHIADIYRQHKDQLYPTSRNNLTPQELPGALQLVFLDDGTPGSTGQHKWNAYEHLREQLVEQGVPRDMVRFIHEAKDDKAKAKLFNEARSGKVAVLIGSTSKMGTGTNVQDRAVALHHLSYPWRPADMEQRDGRIERQGNLNSLNVPAAPGSIPEDVRILYYITENTFDEFRLGTLERKAVFINQMARRDFKAREMEDIGDVAVSLGSFRAIASGNPAIAERAIAQGDLVDLQRLDAGWDEEQSARVNRIETLGRRIAALEEALPAMTAAVDRRQDVSGDNFRMQVGGEEFEDRTGAATALGERLAAIAKDTRYRDGETIPLGEIGGIGFLAEVSYDADNNRLVRLRLDHPPAYLYASRPDVRGLYAARKLSDTSGRGAIQSLEGLLKSLDTDRDKALKDLADSRQAREVAQAHIGGTNPYRDAVAAAERRMQSLTELVMGYQTVKKLKERVEEAKIKGGDTGDLRKQIKEAEQQNGILQRLADSDKPDLNAIDNVQKQQAAAAEAAAQAEEAKPETTTLDPQKVREELDSITPKGTTRRERQSSSGSTSGRSTGQQPRGDQPEQTQNQGTPESTTPPADTPKEAPAQDGSTQPGGAASAQTPSGGGYAGVLTDEQEKFIRGQKAVKGQSEGLHWIDSGAVTWPSSERLQNEGRVNWATNNGLARVAEDGGQKRLELTDRGRAWMAVVDDMLANPPEEQLHPDGSKRMTDDERANMSKPTMWTPRMARGLEAFDAGHVSLNQRGVHFRKGATIGAREFNWADGGGLVRTSQRGNRTVFELTDRGREMLELLRGVVDRENNGESSPGAPNPAPETAPDAPEPEATPEPKLSNAQAAALDSALNSLGPDKQVDGHPRMLDSLVRLRYAEKRYKPGTGGRKIPYYVLTPEGRRRAQALRDEREAAHQARLAAIDAADSDAPAASPQAPTPRPAGQAPAAPRTAPARDRGPVVHPFATDSEWRRGMVYVEAAEFDISRAAEAAWGRDGEPATQKLRDLAFEAVAAVEAGDFEDGAGALAEARGEAQRLRDGLSNRDRQHLDAPLAKFGQVADDYLARHAVTMEKRRREDAQRDQIERESREQFERSLGLAPTPAPEAPAADTAPSEGRAWREGDFQPGDMVHFANRSGMNARQQGVFVRSTGPDTAVLRGRNGDEREVPYVDIMGRTRDGEFRQDPPADVAETRPAESAPAAAAADDAEVGSLFTANKADNTAALGSLKARYEEQFGGEARGRVKQLSDELFTFLDQQWGEAAGDVFGPASDTALHLSSALHEQEMTPEERSGRFGVQVGAIQRELRARRDRLSQPERETQPSPKPTPEPVATPEAAPAAGTGDATPETPAGPPDIELPKGQRWVHKDEVRPGDVVRFFRDGELSDESNLITTKYALHDGASWDRFDRRGKWTGSHHGSWPNFPGDSDYTVIVDKGPGRTAANRHIKHYGDYTRNELAKALRVWEEQRQERDQAARADQQAPAATPEAPAGPGEWAEGDEVITPERGAGTIKAIANGQAAVLTRSGVHMVPLSELKRPEQDAPDTEANAPQAPAAPADGSLDAEERQRRQDESEAIVDDLMAAEQWQRVMSKEQSQQVSDLLDAYRQGDGDPAATLREVADEMEKFAAEVEATESGSGRGRLGAGWARKARDRALQVAARHDGDTAAPDAPEAPEAPATPENAAGREWNANDWAVTPNGEGRVILAEDGEVVVLDGGGAPRTYEPWQLSLPGETRTAEHDAPTAKEAARTEKRQRDLEAAQTPEGLELFYGGRLANLNLEEGHGQVLDEQGNQVGWIRRRGNVWRGQDARGGFAAGATTETPSNPLHAPEEAAQAIDNRRGDDKMSSVPLKDTTWRHLRPEEGRDQVQYSDFSEAQRDEFFKLTKEWQKSDDPELRHAAQQWGQGGLNYQQMNRLADELAATADGVDTSTPEGRRRQGVLQRAADKVRTQARRAWLQWQTMPPHGEPDAQGNHDNPDWVPYGHRETPVKLDATQVRDDLAALRDGAAPDATSEQSRYGGDMVPTSEIKTGDWVHAVSADPAYNEPMHMVGRVILATPLSNGQVRVEVESRVTLNGKDAVRTEFALFHGTDLMERLPEGNPGRDDSSDLKRRIESNNAMRLAAKVRVPAGWQSVNGSRIEPRSGDRFRIRLRRGGTQPEHMNVVVEGPADRDGYWRVQNQPLSFHPRDIVAAPEGADVHYQKEDTPEAGHTAQASPEPSTRYGGDIVGAGEIREGDWVSVDSDNINGKGPGRAVGQVTRVNAHGDKVTLDISAQNPRGKGTVGEHVTLKPADRVERLPEGNPGREDTTDLARRMDALKEEQRQARIRVPEGWKAVTDGKSLTLRPGDHVRIQRGTEQRTGRPVYKNVVLERTWDKEGDEPDDQRWMAVGDSFSFRQSDIVAVPENAPEEHDDPDDDNQDDNNRRRRRNRPNGGGPDGPGGPGLPGMPGLPDFPPASSGAPSAPDGPDGGRRHGRKPGAGSGRPTLDSQAAARHFGSAAKLQELAGQAHVVPDISGHGPYDEVWLNGRKIGSLVEAGDGSGWTPVGKFVEVTDDSPRFQDREADLAELVRQAQEHGDIPTDRLLPSMPFVGSIPGMPESLPGQNFTPEELKRYQALRSLLEDLRARRSASGNIADDISHAIDEIGWVTGRSKLGRGVYWKPEADAASLRRLLDTVQPDNPRAAHHEASRDRAAWKALTDLEASGASTPTPIGQLRAGDAVRVNGRRPSWDLNPQPYSGYLRSKKKVTRTRDGKSEKLWEVQLGGTPWTRDESLRVIPQHDRTVHVPADATGDLLARADDVDMRPEDYAAPNRPDRMDASTSLSEGAPSTDGANAALAAGNGDATGSAADASRAVPSDEEMSQYRQGNKYIGNISPEGERRLFGSPERMHELASGAELVAPAHYRNDDGQVWRNGRLIGTLTAQDLHSPTPSANPRSWASHDPIAGPGLHFSTREAATAHLVLRDMQRGEPDLGRVDERVAHMLANVRTPTEYLGPDGYVKGYEALDKDGLARLDGLRELLRTLARGVAPSGNVADDLDKAHDEAMWLASHYKKPEIQLRAPNYQGPALMARGISEWLDALRPEDPRAANHIDRKARADQAFLRDFLASGPGAVQVKTEELRQGDIVTLEGPLTLYQGATGRRTGYVVGQPKKATLTIDGKRQKALRIVVARDMHTDPRLGKKPDTFIMPLGSSSPKLLARAEDYTVPADDQPYGMPDGSGQADAPQAAAPEAPAPRTGEATDTSRPHTPAPSAPGADSADAPGTSTAQQGTATPRQSTAPGEQSPAPQAPAPAADRPARAGGEQRQRPEPPAPQPATSAPAPAAPSGETTPERPAEPEPIGGRPAEWVQVSDVNPGDLVRLEGITKTGTPRTLAGYVADGPKLVPTVRARKVQDMFRVLLADEPDGSGKRSSVWLPQDAAAARATQDGADMFEGAPQTGAGSDVLTGRIADQVGTDASGNGLFPGSLVTDHDGNEGVVVGSNAGTAQVQFGDSHTDDAHSPSSLTVTDGGAARPAGWTADGHRVTDDSLVGDREGNMLGTVEAVDGDTATVATPDGMTPMPISGLRVIGRTADDGQGDKVSRVETVSSVNQGDVILLPGPNRGPARAYRVTGIDRDGQGWIYLQDVVTGEPDNIPGGGPEDTDGVYERLVDRDGNAPDLGPEDAPKMDEPIQVHEPAPAVDPVDGPTVDPELSPEERDAIADRGTAPGDDPEAQQAAARIGQDLPVTPEQAQALAEGLREGADTSTPEGRAAKRAADHLDQAASSSGETDGTTPDSAAAPDVVLGGKKRPMQPLRPKRNYIDGISREAWDSAKETWDAYKDTPMGYPDWMFETGLRGKYGLKPDAIQEVLAHLKNGTEPAEFSGRSATPDVGVPEGRPEPSTVGEVGVGDTVTMPDENDPDTLASYRVADIAEGPAGLRILTLEDGDGNRSPRALPASQSLHQLPEVGAPAADGDAESRDPNPVFDRDAFMADHADAVARAVVDGAIEGTTTPGSIHQLRQQIAEKVTTEAMRSAMQKLRQDATAALDAAGITGDERKQMMAALRKQVTRSRVAAVRAAVRTLDDLEPLDGESPEDTAKRAADLLRLIPEALRNRPTPEPDGGQAAGRVADEVSSHVDDAVGAALQGADSGPLTPERRARIVQQLAQRMADSRQDAAQQIAAQLPDGQRPGVIARVVAALTQIARRVVELVKAFLKGIARAVTAPFRAINRFREGIARRIRSWPETRRLRRLAAAQRSLTMPADGMSLAQKVTHWVGLMPAPGRFGQVARRRRWYRPAARAALASGQLPQVQDGARWTMDRAADRGPGRQALRHLAALRAAGLDVDADLAARLTAAAPELGDDPHGTVRHARRYQQRADARVRDLRAVAAGINAPDLGGEIAAAQVEAQHARQEADRLQQAYTAALPGAVRDTLSQVREMGPGGRDRLTMSHRSDPAAARALTDVARYVPRDWLADRSARFLTAVTGDAGAYDPNSGTATVADLGDGGRSTAAAALLRHVQRNSPDLLAAQEAFGFTRTHTGRPGARRSALDGLLQRLFGGRADQVTDDQIVARGLATMFSGDWYRDDDLRAFLLGLLATR
ncbi:DEAD/DEAH box helicase family protein [Streptomyces griseoluteus]|uniref:DEAD/DEAH box helicase family protein n=1 Tax=Streptomyces griseoluteus TaxID=29306 RepID=UPI0033DF17F6